MGTSGHRIHLRRPWQIAQRGATVLWTRRFGRPRLAPGEQVWLLLEGLPAGTTASLNGRPLDGRGGVDVTALLLARNQLALQAPAGAGPPGDAPGQVALEIRPASE